MTATFYVGDAIEVMSKLPEKSVDLILTSPPFLALRSYLPADHPDKALEGGSQATPGEFIDWLLDVVEACARVLAPHGSLCIELGDTYSGSGESGWERDKGEYRSETRSAASAAGLLQQTRNLSTGWPLAKSLSLIPESFRWAMVYGMNPFTGRQTDRWRLRNVIRWVRPNPPVGALGDKFRPATSELMVFCKSAKRYFDLDSVRGDVSEWTRAYGTRPVPGSERWDEKPTESKRMVQETTMNQQGAPPLDWWNIPPGGFSGAHYAVWPPELLIKPIKAMCPEKVCRTCGEPSRRIVDVDGLGGRDFKAARTGINDRDTGLHGPRLPMPVITRSTLGFSDCGHDNWRPGLVLDPFAGSGTTGAVATGHGRDAILIDLDERNYELALDRVGPFILSKGEVAA